MKKMMILSLMSLAPMFAGSFSCNREVTGGEFTNIEVPVKGYCFLNGRAIQVTGNVNVQDGGTLIVNGVNIQGNLTANNGTVQTLSDASVQPVALTTVGKNVTVNGGIANLTDIVAKNNVTISNSLLVLLTNAKINSNLAVTGTTGPVRVVAVNAGSASFIQNSGGVSFLDINNLGTVGCSGNNPLPTGSSSCLQ
jgi:hypothetical protein